MSNSKVRKALEKQQRSTKLYDEYKKAETLLTNYQMCKAYFKDASISIIGLVEKILAQKYNLPWQLKFIRRATMAVRGQSNGLVSIPQFKYNERVHDILSMFVKRNFDKMVADQKNNREYPFMFRDIIEKYS